MGTTNTTMESRHMLVGAYLNSTQSTINFGLEVGLVNTTSEKGGLTTTNTTMKQQFRHRSKWTTMEVDGVHLFVNEELVETTDRQRSRRPSDENPFGWIFGD